MLSLSQRARLVTGLAKSSPISVVIVAERCFLSRNSCICLSSHHICNREFQKRRKRSRSRSQQESIQVIESGKSLPSYLKLQPFLIETTSRVAGEGPKIKKRAGDVYIECLVQPHPLFKRQGTTLRLQVNRTAR